MLLFSRFGRSPVLFIFRYFLPNFALFGKPCKISYICVHQFLRKWQTQNLIWHLIIETQRTVGEKWNQPTAWGHSSLIALLFYSVMQYIKFISLQFALFAVTYSWSYTPVLHWKKVAHTEIYAKMLNPLRLALSSKLFCSVLLSSGLFPGCPVLQY